MQKPMTNRARGQFSCPALWVLFGLGMGSTLVACATRQPPATCFQMNGEATVPLQANLLGGCCDKMAPPTNSSSFHLQDAQGGRMKCE